MWALLAAEPQLAGAVDDAGRSAFVLAYLADRPEMAAILREQGIELDLIRFLAERGAELEAVGYKFDAAGQTPLALACAREQDASARLLRDLGARI